MDMSMNYYGITGLILLILDVWAIVSVFSSNIETGKKVMWIVLVLVLPAVGFIAWFLFGPRVTKS
jgi:hypothetical protein